jgi:hypothetical protein
MGYQLGGFPWSWPDTISSECVRLRGCGGLHCYGLNDRGLQRSFDHVLWHSREDVDQATARLQAEEPHFYAPPRFFVSQRAGLSDNAGVFLDYGAEYRPDGGYET